MLIGQPVAIIYSLHPTDPQPRRIQQIRDALRGGALMLYPTDTNYAIGCDLTVKSALQRVRQLKQLTSDKPLTFLCPSLAQIALYAKVSDPNYRLMRSLVPGPYTFILPATKLVPQLVLHPKRKTTGIRVPDHGLCQTLLAALENPIISTSARLPDTDPTLPMDYDTHKWQLFEALDSWVDLILDNDTPVVGENSTILDLTEDEPVIRRAGLGYERVAHWDIVRK